MFFTEIRHTASVSTGLVHDDSAVEGGWEHLSQEEIEASLNEKVEAGIQEIGSPETEATVYETVDPAELAVENPTENATEQPAPQQTTTPAKPRTIEEIVAAAANDRLTWELDDGTLWIGGKGIIKPIQSAEEQPWAAVREQIEIVRFEEGSELLLDDIAYWFSGCVNLTYADLPGFIFVIGTDAFKDCSKLEELGFYLSPGTHFQFLRYLYGLWI